MKTENKVVIFAVPSETVETLEAEAMNEQIELSELVRNLIIDYSLNLSYFPEVDIYCQDCLNKLIKIYRKILGIEHVPNHPRNICSMCNCTKDIPYYQCFTREFFEE